LPDSFKRVDDALPLEKTQWFSHDSLDTDQFQVNASPNPTTNDVLISISGRIPFGENWYLTDVNGTRIQENKIDSPSLILDLSVYPSGVYYFLIPSENEKNVTQIIKQ
jgi:hypothetical protein